MSLMEKSKVFGIKAPSDPTARRKNIIERHHALTTKDVADPVIGGFYHDTISFSKSQLDIARTDMSTTNEQILKQVVEWPYGEDQTLEFRWDATEPGKRELFLVDGEIISSKFSEEDLLTLELMLRVFEKRRQRG